MKRLLLLGALLFATSAYAQTTCTYTFNDASGNPQTVNAYCDGSSHIWPLFTPTDKSGNPLVSAGGVTVNPANAAQWGITALSASVPLSALYVGVNTGNNLTGLHVCGQQAAVSFTASGDLPIVSSLGGGTNIYVCDYEVSSNGNTIFYIESSTGGNCTGTLKQLGTSWNTTQYWGKAASNAFYRGVNTGGNNYLCGHNVNSASLSATVWYDQY